MLHFRYGCVGAAKSANLLMLNHSILQKGNRTILLKSAIDTRDEAKIKSRVGLESICNIFTKEDNLISMLSNLDKDIVILIDEVQFCTVEQVYQLIELARDRVIYMYGLKSTYMAELFESIAPLLVYADSIQEIETICSCCNSKATLNLRVVNGKPQYNGEVISIGDINVGEDYYLAVCSEHYRNPILK